MIYLLFFLSGISGLIYQVIWVRMFGNVFGNTISSSIVVAVFMLGLGAGSYFVGAWADRGYVSRPDSLLRAYGYVELVIAAMGLAIAAALPHLGTLSALMSSYAREASGWYALSPGSYLARAAIAVLLLTPITLLMGGTLTLLIRHLVRADLETGSRRIALLYGVNTAGAARCFMDGNPVASVKALPAYLALLDLAYRAAPGEVLQARRLAERSGRIVAGSHYLGMIVPESPGLYNSLGIAAATEGRLDEAVGQFSHALTLDPGNAATHWHMGVALASVGRRAEALEHLQRSVQIEPGNSAVQHDLGLMLAFAGRLDEAAAHFERALEIDPQMADARRNLDAVRAQQRAAPK